MAGLTLRETLPCPINVVLATQNVPFVLEIALLYTIVVDGKGSSLLVDHGDNSLSLSFGHYILLLIQNLFLS